MKLIKKFLEKRKNSKFESLGNILKKELTTKDQRAEALEVLRTAPFQYSIPQLLKRFELVLEHGMLDNKEKETCVDIILKHGENAKKYIYDALKNKRRIAWIIKIAEKIYSEEEYIDILLENLISDSIVFDSDWTERQTELLLALKEKKSPLIGPKVIPFLETRNEEVKIAAMECLEEQAWNNESIRKTILALSKQEPNDDNSRIIGIAKQIVTKNKWL